MIALVYQICLEISLVSVLILIMFTCYTSQFTSWFIEKKITVYKDMCVAMNYLLLKIRFYSTDEI